MSKIIDKLTYLQESKAQVLASLKEKNINILESTPFREYSTLIRNSVQGIRVSTFERPLDWITMPTLTEGAEEIYCLCPVYST